MGPVDDCEHLGAYQEPKNCQKEQSLYLRPLHYLSVYRAHIFNDWFINHDNDDCGGVWPRRGCGLTKMGVLYDCSWSSHYIYNRVLHIWRW